jgi:hypothetical protein
MQTIEEHRQFWANIAKEYGWYTEPFYVQVFIDPETKRIYDSVSFSGMTGDIEYFEPEDDNE